MSANHLVFSLLLCNLLSACSTHRNLTPQQDNPYPITKNYHPDDPALYAAIVREDSLFFDAYNHCDTKLEAHMAYYEDNVEFYHDKGGLATSKADLRQGLQQNVCGKVRRTLVPGSIEVYPIGNYGAIELGLHSFYNKFDPPAGPEKVGRFIVIWHKRDDGWKVARVVSLH